MRREASTVESLLSKVAWSSREAGVCASCSRGFVACGRVAERWSKIEVSRPPIISLDAFHFHRLVIALTLDFLALARAGNFILAGEVACRVTVRLNSPQYLRAGSAT